MKKMLIENQVVLIAALLHDIGKFRQRAFWGKEHKAHDQQGADWIEANLIFKFNFFSFEDKQRTIQAIREHHERPYDRDALTVLIADRLASGERLKRQDEEPGSPSSEPLISIFNSVQILNRSAPEKRWVYNTKPLRLDKNIIFPFPEEDVKVDYESLWGDFETEINILPSSAFYDVQTACSILLALIHKYCWCIPAAVYRNEPDVSLADHLKMTTAVALCISEFDNEKLNRFEEASECYNFPDEPACLLVGADVSGIQKFLYAISSDGAAKSLRGRSSYLCLLSEAVARYILKELNLPLTNLIYCSGGHFYLLSPLSAQSELTKLSNKIAEILLEIHRGELNVVVDSVTIRGRDFSIQNGGLPTLWKELTQKLVEQKNRPLRSLANSHFNIVFGPFSGGGLQTRCSVCHEESYIDNIERIVKTWGEVEPEKCSLCQSFEGLGDDIAKQSTFLIILPRKEPPERILEWHTALAMLGFDFWLCDKERFINKSRQHPITALLNDTDITSQDRFTIHEFRWMPTFTPIENNTIIDLEKMAENSKGASYWAALRMDVDNLGRVFQKGLKESYSLSRVATLSRMLSLFFEGYLNNICTVIDPERKHLYLLYSGGDDLFIVGSWDKTIEAAQLIHDDFTRFTCQNPSLTLSGGISIHHTKFPLYQAAEDAKKHLETAKCFKHSDEHDKDALGFFGQVMSWEKFNKVGNWKDLLVNIIEYGKPDDDGKKTRLSRGFLFKLANIANLGAQQKRAEQLSHYSYVDLNRLVYSYKAKWRLAYHIARESKDFRDDLQQLSKELLKYDDKYFTHLNTLAYWVELATRKE